MLGFLRAPRAFQPAHKGLLSSMIEARRGIRFNSLGESFQVRAHERQKQYMKRRFPRLGPLRNLQPDAKLYRVRLVRSPRHLPRPVRMSAETLGFGKDETRLSGITRNRTVWVPQTALFAGRILKIKELVRVSLCTEADRKEELAYHAGRRDRMKGYEVIGRATEMSNI